ncbi:MAG: DUF354 domain-containing protein [Planctomycetes bacterium]|nr:DUF354 domain-containing protein [Planctomycetota bacterium]
MTDPMRILVEITDAKHVHLFKHAVRELEARGHTAAITARDRDIITGLLSAYGFGFTTLSRQGFGLWGLGKELLVRDWRLLRFCRRFRPDVLVGRVGPCAAHVGFFLRKPVIVFEDTEHARLQQWISFPFATRVCTAVHYEKDWGRKHIRYKSFDELAYLHPNRFTPEPQVVERAGLDPAKPYVVVRFLSWAAAHDRGQKGIDPARRLDVLERLKRFARVVVSSEAPLPGEFDRFRLPAPPHDFHHLLAFSRLYLGEGSTGAAEAAVLGVPGIYVSTIRLGYLNRLEHHYGLAFSVSEEAAALGIAERLLADPATPELWRERRQRLLSEEEDLTPWMVREIERLGRGRDA